jgi:hypothetical protein
LEATPNHSFFFLVCSQKDNTALIDDLEQSKRGTGLAFAQAKKHGPRRSKKDEGGDQLLS